MKKISSNGYNKFSSGSIESGGMYPNNTIEQKMRLLREDTKDSFRDTHRYEKALSPKWRDVFTTTIEDNLKVQRKEKALSDDSQQSITERRFDEDPELYTDRRPSDTINGEPHLLTLYWRLDQKGENTEENSRKVIEKKMR